MLDRKYIIENADAVRQNCRNRGVAVDLDQYLALDKQRADLTREVEELNSKANDMAKRIGPAKDSAQREQLKEQARVLREQKNAKQAELDQLLELTTRGIQQLIAQQCNVIGEGRLAPRSHRRDHESGKARRDPENLVGA